MKTKNLLTVAAVSAGLAFSVTAQAHGNKKEEQTLNKSDVPAAVQQAAQTNIKGQNIVRWEKEGANYEAIFNQNGKEMALTIDPNGKLLGRHNEAKENEGTASKY